jgi:hypothetical protein
MEESMSFDTTKLVVGQEVYMICGYFTRKGKVVKVTSSGVDVEKDGWVYHFDPNGKEYEGSRDDMYRIPEDGAQELDNMPFEEREAQMEASLRPIREWQKKARKAWEERYGGLSPEEYRAVLEEKARKAREELSPEERQAYDRRWEKFSGSERESVKTCGLRGFLRKALLGRDR